MVDGEGGGEEDTLPGSGTVDEEVSVNAEVDER